MFLTTHKCGSTFMKLFSLINFTNKINSKSQDEGEELIKSHFHTWKNKNNITINDLYNPKIKKFQIVRNPYDRFRSYFQMIHKEKSLGIVGRGDVGDTIEKTLGFLINSHPSELRTQIEWDASKRRERKFKTLPSRYLQFYEHLYPQYSWLFSKYFIPIKLENLDEILKNKFPNFKIPNNSFSHHIKEKKIKLNQESKNQIYELYRDDFVKFNYKK
jgi:hypothetical protein